MTQGHVLVLAAGAARPRYLAQTGDRLWWTADRLGALRFPSAAHAERFRSANVDGPVRVDSGIDG